MSKVNPLTVFAALSGFLAHHVQDLHSIAGAIRAVASAVPVSAGERAHLTGLVDKITTAADNISASLPRLTDTDAMTASAVSASDVEAIVKRSVANALDGLPGLDQEAVRAHAASAAPDATDTSGAEKPGAQGDGTADQQGDDAAKGTGGSKAGTPPRTR